MAEQRVQLQFRVLLRMQQLGLLRQREHQSRGEEEEVLAEQEGGLRDVDFGLLELPVLVLEQDDERDVDGGEQEQRH